MNFRTCVILLILISSTLADTSCPTMYYPNQNDQNLEYCSDLGLPSVPKGDGDSKNLYESTDNEFSSCCFLKYSLSNGQQGTSCLSLTEEEVENRNIAYSRLMKVYSEATGTITCEEDNKEDNKSNGVNYLDFNLYLVLFILLNV